MKKYLVNFIVGIALFSFNWFSFAETTMSEEGQYILIQYYF